MDFESMLVTPVMYRDIGSSFMMQPMAMPYMMPGIMPMVPGALYPAIAPMQPALTDDKFEKKQIKEQENKTAMKRSALALAILGVGGWFLSKRFKIKMPKIGQSLKNGAISVKNWSKKIFSKKTNP